MKSIDGKTVIREGKCIECDARIFVFQDGTRSRCDCHVPGYTREQRELKQWLEEAFLAKKN